MSKTKLLLDLVDCLRNLTGTLEEITACIAGNEPTEAAEQSNALPNNAGLSAPSSPAAPPAPVSDNNPHGLAPNERMDPVTGEISRLDLPTLRALAASKAQTKEQKAQMKAMLQKHGVAKLTELPLSDYFAFQEEVEAIV